MNLALLVLISLFSVSVDRAPTTKLCEGFLPLNRWSIPNDFADAQTGITQVEFNNVATKLTGLYSAEIQAKGGHLDIRPLWDNATVNSDALRNGQDWIVEMFGGLARYHGMTPDAEALVVCHELGHHLGGAPKFTIHGPTGTWGTVEGGADYFAGLKCLRKYFAADSKTMQIAQTLNLPPVVEQSCKAQFQTAIEQAICLRSAAAGQVVAGIFHDLSKDPNPPNFATPDKSAVRKTFEDHPATQCRLDTYFQGSLCRADVQAPLSDTDYTQGSCSKVEGDTIGNRPPCWFAGQSAVSNPITKPM